MLMARLQPAEDNAENVPSYDAKAVSEVNASSKVHEQLSHVKRKTIIQTTDDDQTDFSIIFNDPFMKNNGGTSEHDSNAHDEYHDIQMLNPERLKTTIAAQPKLYNGDSLHSANLNIDSPDSEETLKDVKESRLKMRNKMVQINYSKLNALYETFVPQQEFSAEQTYFSIPSTSNNGSESKEVTSELPILKMPKESRLLKMFDIMGVEINGLQTRIDKTLLEDRERRWMSDSQNSLREFYKTDVILMSNSLYKRLKEIKEELIEEKNELLKDELEKSLSDSKDIQANLLKRIKILENDIKLSQAQSIDFELKLQHQKEKMTCDVSWKSKLSTLNDENVLLKTQVESVV
ncbi:hypothetical protein Tco_0592932 [Tanacetum coccineum]